jgi:hypothetical protein
MPRPRGWAPVFVDDDGIEVPGGEKDRCDHGYYLERALLGCELRRGHPGPHHSGMLEHLLEAVRLVHGLSRPGPVGRCVAKADGGRCAGLEGHEGEHYANARDRKEVR